MIVWKRLRNNWRSVRISKNELFCSKRGVDGPSFGEKRG